MSKYSFLICLVLLSGCSEQEKREPIVVVNDGSPEQVPVDIASIADAVPQYEPWSASVNPESYVVLGKTYKV
ncbi:MAG: septal ring lytic transglycosylase RlpA, partial [Methyloprofundus sp.]|nr:septal ring lytic transglycosylase RlpA [Methyloprofundus sp.]